MNSAYAVGATFTIENLASPEIGKLSGQLEKLDAAIEQTKLGLKNILPAGIGGKINALALEFDELGPSAEKGSRGIIEAMRLANAGVEKSALEMKTSLDGMFSGIFAGLDTEMSAATSPIVANFGRITASAEASMRAVIALSGEMRTLGLASEGFAALPGGGGGRGGGMGPRAARGHGTGGNGSRGGFHIRPPSTHVPGVGHVSAHGDGMVEAIAGFAVAELVKTGVEHAFEMKHWDSQIQDAGFSTADIDGAKAAAWNNARQNPNASASEGLKNILELNKATGNLHESEGLLPAFSIAAAAMESVKATNLHSKFNEDGQVLNLARGLEEMGITMRGNTEEERAGNVKHYTSELVRTMIASRGLFDGNALYALTNNSGGAAQNWDERMGTVVAPILGDIMKHSKLGNADYMATKSYAGGGITSKAVEALNKYGLTEEGDTYQDSKKQWHLNPNSKFADGISENIFDWSRKILDKLKAKGVDTSDQKQVNAVVNEIGSNKSTTMMLRALLEPGTRAQIVKEMVLRDKVPENAAGILQDQDPVLKLDAMHKKLDDFLTALGGPLVDPAMAGLTKLTDGLSALAQMMNAHPELTKIGGIAGAVGGVGLLGYGGGKMLGLWGGADAGLTAAATKLDLAADHLMMVNGGVPGGPAGVTPVNPTTPGKTPGNALAEMTLQGFIYGNGKQAMDSILGWSTKNQSDLDNATSGKATFNRIRGMFGSGGETHPDDDRSSRASKSESDAYKLQDSLMKAASQQLGSLNTQTGFVLTSFDGLKSGSAALSGDFGHLATGSGGLDNAFRIVELTAMGAARALATLAMSGGTGGVGSGIINASWGGGGGGGSGGSWNGNPLAIGGGFGSAGWSKSGATRSTVADYIRHAFGAQGVDPATALRVAQSEGLDTYVGDHGTSFGAFQLHYGGSGIRGMNSGGLGDRFTRETGLNARDPSTWKAQIDYAAKIAKAEGWGAWHGARHVGIGNRQGIGTYRGGAGGGAPAGTQVHNHAISVKLDGKTVGKAAYSYMAETGRYPTSMGGPDSHSHYTSPGTPVPDSA